MATAPAVSSAAAGLVGAQPARSPVQAGYPRSPTVARAGGGATRRTTAAAATASRLILGPGIAPPGVLPRHVKFRRRDRIRGVFPASRPDGGRTPDARPLVDGYSTPSQCGDTRCTSSAAWTRP